MLIFPVSFQFYDPEKGSQKDAAMHPRAKGSAWQRRISRHENLAVPSTCTVKQNVVTLATQKQSHAAKKALTANSATITQREYLAIPPKFNQSNLQ